MTRLIYIGQRRQPYFIRGVITHHRYQVTPGQPFEVDDRDARPLLHSGGFQVYKPPKRRTAQPSEAEENHAGD